jgi:predicted nucleotidyltransferase component of viral defense system
LIKASRYWIGLSRKVEEQVKAFKNTKTPFDIDMGVGDIVVPKPELILLPTQLDDFKRPKIMTYSLESIIAEKVDAIISRMELSSRMKDYYDIFYIANTFNFEIVLLTIDRFISPFYDAITHEIEFFGVWNSAAMKYE